MRRKARPVGLWSARAGIALGLATLCIFGSGPPVLLAAQVPPQESPPDQSPPPAAREAIDQLWSPYCPGLMLEVCTSAGGAAMRDSIAAQARAGLTSDEIVDYWVARFGEEYRATPKFEGSGSLAWITPYLMLLAGLAVAVGVALNRRSRTRPQPVSDVTPEQSARLAEALEELDETEAPDF